MKDKWINDVMEKMYQIDLAKPRVNFKDLIINWLDEI